MGKEGGKKGVRARRPPPAARRGPRPAPAPPTPPAPAGGVALGWGGLGGACQDEGAGARVADGARARGG